MNSTNPSSPASPCARVIETLRASRLVCPVCSSNLVYPMLTHGGYICGHCDSMFAAPAPGCPLGDAGLHDETWMNDGLCACGSDGSAKPAGVIE